MPPILYYLCKYSSKQCHNSETNPIPPTQITTIHNDVTMTSPGIMYDVLKAVWVEKVEEVEELLQVVLQRSARQEKLVLQIIHTQHSKELQST